MPTHSRPRCAAPYRAALIVFLTALFGNVAAARAQTPEDTQKHNINALGTLLQARPDSPPMLHSAAAGPLIQSLDHLNEMSAMTARIAGTPNPDTRKLLSKELSIRTLQFSQEEWKAPSLGDTSPDPLIALAMQGDQLDDHGNQVEPTDPPLRHIALWNHAALDLTSIDHTVADVPLLHPEYAEQFGPPCTSRAMAIVHLAMFEAINLVERRYASYQPANDTTSIQQAVMKTLNLTAAQLSAQTVDENTLIEYAAVTTLVGLYPAKAGYLNTKWTMPDNAAILAGLTLPNPVDRIALGKSIGQAIGAEILARRAQDSSQLNGRCFIGKHISELKKDGTEQPADPQYQWIQDPLHRNPDESKNPDTALGSEWANVMPFVMTKASQFRAVNPWPLPPNFEADFALTRIMGGDKGAKAAGKTAFSDATAPTFNERTDDQTHSGIFWAYDATPGLCAPPRLYNMIVTSIARNEKQVTDPVEMARLLALVNVAMADAAISAWDGKYHYRFARPVSGIRGQKAPDGSFPHATWTPLGAQATNTATVNLTPPFPAYPSGHATFGGAFFQVMRDFWGVSLTDRDTAFSFVSDEFNGFNLSPVTGHPRPQERRFYQSFAQAESENALSRLYLGVHWKLDADAGDAEGRQVGDWVYKNMFKRLQ